MINCLFLKKKIKVRSKKVKSKNNRTPIRYSALQNFMCKYLLNLKLLSVMTFIIPPWQNR